MSSKTVGIGDSMAGSQMLSQPLKTFKQAKLSPTMETQSSVCGMRASFFILFNQVDLCFVLSFFVCYDFEALRTFG